MKETACIKRALLLTALLTACLSSWADEEKTFEAGGIYYKTSSDTTVSVTYKDTKYNSYSGKVSIPETVADSAGTLYTVTAIGDSAFRKCDSLTEVSIPSTVTAIADYAFYNCSALPDITLPAGVTTIGARAFYGCSAITSMTIPENVVTIDDYAFRSCTSLESIKIPESVTTLGTYVFKSCTSLKEAFVPKSIVSFGDYVFSGCSALTDVTLEEGLTTIGTQAFNSCTSLESITIPESVTSIGTWAFSYCSALTSVSLPQGLTSIKDHTFDKCTKLASLTIPEKVKTIGQYVFEYCYALESITIPESVTTISNGAFNYCEALKTITIPDGVTSIGQYTFQYCTKLESAIIGSGLEEIPNYAFMECPALKKVVIGSGVSKIGNLAFDACSKLSQIICLNPAPATIQSDSFDDVNKRSCSLIVLQESESDYASADYWSEFSKIVAAVATEEATEKSFSSATLCAQIAADALEPSAQGFEYGTTEELEDASGIEAEMGEDGAATAALTELTPGTPYYYRAYAETEYGTIYGTVLSLTLPVAPTATTMEASEITDVSATLNASVEAGDEEISDQGFEYWTEGGEVQIIAVEADSEGNMTLDLSDLEPETEYSFRAYAATETGTVYGETVTFSTEEAGIGGITADPGSAEEVGRYDLNGRRLAEPQQGVNIVRYSDGTAEKVVVK